MVRYELLSSVRRAVAIPVCMLGGMLLLASSGAEAQEGEAGQSAAAQRETRQTPAMRERVYTRLSEAQACAEEDDMACARRLLEEVRLMDGLNSYETAQMWNFYAFIYFNQDNYPEAITAYENVLAQPDLPLGLETQTMYTLCQLYFQQEMYQQSLDMLDRWFTLAENPGADAYVLKAQLHYSLQQYQAGIEPIQTALRIAEARGVPVQENWYRLLNVFYYELEDYPNVISVLRTMIQRWPKREYFVQLAGMYGQQGDEFVQLALFEVAYEADWLLRGTELVNYAQMLLAQDVPYKAATVLNEGLQDGTIESTEQNWRILAQAWQLAQEDEQAVPALTRAASLSDEGTLDVRLAQSYQNLTQWEECVDAARTGLDKGGLARTDQAHMILGACLFELKQYDQARNAFRTAANDERSRAGAENWLAYLEAEETRERQLAEALDNTGTGSG